MLFYLIFYSVNSIKKEKTSISIDILIRYQRRKTIVKQIQ